MTWLRRLLPSRPGGRAGTALVVVLLLSGVLVAAVGAGYSASRPFLGDGSAFLGKGHTVAHVNGETGRSDAEVALQLATGKEELQPVRLPDGRLVIVNKTTGTVSYLDGATLAPESVPTVRPTSAGNIEPVATDSDGYLVDKSRNTLEQITAPGTPPPAPVQVPAGISAAVPCANSVWVTTPGNEVIEVRAGRALRTIPLGVAPVGITVADGHPVVVGEDGTAFVVDGDSPTAIGKLGLSGRSVALGGWRGAGRMLVAVDRATGRFAALDPRTGHGFAVTLGVKAGRAELDSPVVLGSFAYVPDYSGPSLWRVNLNKGTADARPLEVPGQPGAFELKVSGGRVWANHQYDRRVLVVDADGHDHYADKGPGRDLGDTEGGSGPPGGAGTPPEGDQEPGIEGPTDGQPGQPSNATVAVPKFPRGTQYREACAALKALNLICRPVAAGDEAGLRTGDVRGTDPAGGRMVPVHSRVVVRYVGPVRTPAVLGVPHTDACRQIQAAKLKCAERVDPAPALAPDQLTRVSTQDPAPRAPLDKGDTVTITYPDSIALPSFADQSWAEACNLIDGTYNGAYRMHCQAVAGNPPAAGKQPGQAYAQDPPAGTVVKVGSTVRLSYYRGESTPGNLVGSSVSAACAELASLGLGCTPVEGSCAWNTGHAVGEVAQQRPPAGTSVPVGTAVSLVYYIDQCDVPGYVGGNAQAACADIGARGFVCNAVAELHPSTNVVFAQDQAAGRYPLGTAITIHYSRWAMVDWWIVQFGAGWRMVVGSGTYRLGYGYAANEDIPGGRGLNEFICGAGGTRCNGYASNVFYSQVGSYGNANFSMQPFAVFMACTGAAGQRPMWRVWNAGMPRGYGMTGQDPGPVGSPSHNPPGGDHELLGCVW